MSSRRAVQRQGPVERPCRDSGKIYRREAVEDLSITKLDSQGSLTDVQ
jgi:hypothetical protein